MRIQVLSDLHLEMHGDLPLPDTGADAVVLAGDIGAGADGVAWAAGRWPGRPVIYVLGNHEHYGGDADAVLAACRAAAREMPDFRLIGHNGAPLTPEATVAWHRRSRAWLEDELARGHDGPTVVVTHHAPHARSNHYDEDPMAPAFVSDLSALIERRPPDLWVHGHTHSAEDYHVGACRIVANQAGYANETTGWVADWIIDVRA